MSSDTPAPRLVSEDSGNVFLRALPSLSANLLHLLYFLFEQRSLTGSSQGSLAEDRFPSTALPSPELSVAPGTRGAAGCAGLATSTSSHAGEGGLLSICGCRSLASPYPHVVLYAEELDEERRTGGDSAAYAITRLEQLLCTEEIEAAFLEHFYLRALETEGPLAKGMQRCELDATVRELFHQFFQDAQRCTFDVLQVMDGDETAGLPDAVRHALGFCPPAFPSPSESSLSSSPLQQEAAAALQFLTSLAFNCPSSCMSAAAHLVLANVTAKRQLLRRQAESSHPRRSVEATKSTPRPQCRNFLKDNKKQLARIRSLNFPVAEDLRLSVIGHVQRQYQKLTAGEKTSPLPPVTLDDESSHNRSRKSKGQGQALSESNSKASEMLKAEERAVRLQYMELFARLDEAEQRRRIRYAGETLQFRESAMETERAVMLTPWDTVLWVRGNGSVHLESAQAVAEEEPLLLGHPVRASSRPHSHRPVCYTAPRRHSAALPLLQYMLTRTEEEAAEVMSELVNTARQALQASDLDEKRRLPVQQRLALLQGLSQCHVLHRSRTHLTRKEILCSVFTECGECPSYYGLLVSTSSHFLATHHAAQRFLFFHDGPLSIESRLMLAVMTASRQRCAYLVRRYATLFWLYVSRVAMREECECWSDEDNDGLEEGAGSGRSWGERRQRWLTHGPPPRLRAAQPWMEIAALQPWRFSEANVQKTLAEGWTVPQLFQLTALIASTLSLSSFTMGLLVPPEPWTATVLPSALQQRIEQSCAAATGGRSADATSAKSHRGDARANLLEQYAGPDTVPLELRSNCPATWLLQSSDFEWQEKGAVCMEQFYPGMASLFLEEQDCWRDSIAQLNPSDAAGISESITTPEFAFSALYAYVLNILGYIVADYELININTVIHRTPKTFAQQMVVRPEKMASSASLFCDAPAVRGARPSERSTRSPSLELPAALWEVIVEHFRRESQLVAVAELRSPSSGTHADVAAAPDPPPAGVPGRVAEWLAGFQAPPHDTVKARGRARAEGGSADDSLEDRSEDALHCAVTLQREKLLLHVATTAMMARRDALLHLLLYAMSSYLHNL